jgi:putative phage-type endonuclease
MSLTEAQFTRRKKGIGASDLSAIVGTSPYTDWREKYQEKALGVRRERDEKLDDLARWGEIMEPVIAAEYARLVKGKHWRVELVGTLEHQKITWALATPDRMIYDSTGLLSHGLEIKNRDKNDKPRWADAHIPAEVATQAHWGMFVTGLPRWDVAALIGGNDLRVLTLFRDDELLGWMHRVAEQWWAGVATTTEPEMEWVEEERQNIQRRLINDSDLAAFKRAAYWRSRKGT